MKKIIFLILFFNIYYIVNTQTVNYSNLDTYNLYQLFKDSNRVNKIEVALKKIILFLEKKDSLHKSLKNSILLKEIEYSSFIPSKYVNYEIIALNKINNYKDIFDISCFINYGNSNIIYRGVVKIGFDYKKNDIIFPEYNLNFKLYKTGNIQFYSNNKFEYKNYYNSILFTKKIINLINNNYYKFKPPPKPLNYIITNNIYNSFEFYGIYFSFNPVSRFIKELNTIIDNKSNGFYKHEIIHYILQNYHFNNFISEALATYFSNGESIYNVNPQKELNNIIHKIQTDTTYKLKINSGLLLTDEMFAKEKYIIGALLLYNLKSVLTPNNFFSEIFETMASLNNIESLNYLKEKLNIQKIADFLVKNKDIKWNLN